MEIEFDPEYYIKIIELINSRDWLKFDTWYNIDDYTDTPEKLIFHLKYYIDRVNIKENIDVTLSEDHRTQFRLTDIFRENTSMYNFPKKIEPKIAPQLATGSETVKKKDPFANLRPVAKQESLNL